MVGRLCRNRMDDRPRRAAASRDKVLGHCRLAVDRTVTHDGSINSVVLSAVRA